MAHRGGVMEFRLLGPLEAIQDGDPLKLGGLRQRALLALLLLNARELVPRERIVDALWGDEPPKTASNAIQVTVHSLRRLLGRERVETRGTGYVVHADDDELDLRRFERLVEEARGEKDPARRGTTLREALALWRGPALADLREAPFAAVEAERLEEARLVALEDRIDAELERGAHLEVVPELVALVEHHPYREGLHRRLMLALYRGGRQAEALEAYGRARARFVDELGMEPGPDLRELERGILRQDPALAAPAGRLRVAPALPVAPTPLVGRELELAAVNALLRREEVRLVTLTGAGGTGKTRLALEAARKLETEFADGVWFVGLAAVRDPELVASTIATALGVAEEGPGALADMLRAEVRDREALLVLDNFEQLVRAAPLLAELLAAAPRLKLLVTSRAVLRLSGEYDYPVPPLSLPDAGTAANPGLLAENEAVALFVERARAVRPGFALEPHARAVADICLALDGLPLALELAAARIKVLPPEALHDRLERRLPLLERGPADVPGRQRTMRATLDWSYDLLDEDERALFAQLAVFSGGCTPAAAEAVCAADLDRLTSLVDWSLLRERPGTQGEVRFAMLETVREYASERLAERGEAEQLQARHAEYFRDLAEQAEAHVASAEAATWLDRLEVEHDNLRAALAWSASSDRRELDLRLVVALRHFWRVRGHLTEGRRWLEDALARATDDVAPGLRARALNAGWVLLDGQGDHRKARAMLEEALSLFRVAGEEGQVARTLSELGGLAALEGDYRQAADRFQETIPLFEAAGDARALAVTTGNLAAVLDLAGDHVRSRAVGLEALALAKKHGDRDQTCITLHNLARNSLHGGRHDEARDQLAESIEIGTELGFREVIANCVEALAELALARGDAERAARLIGASDAILEELACRLGPHEQESRDAAVAALTDRLGEERLAQLSAEGGRLPTEEVLALALA